MNSKKRIAIYRQELHYRMIQHFFLPRMIVLLIFLLVFVYMCFHSVEHFEPPHGTEFGRHHHD